ncbi:MAG: NAD(P)-dependent oxidoreductase [Gammaproteobacteria bacterium]|nr:NAD(P)-dependent oxidoreductase [Gammaproteobacteria bacterium]
MDVIITGATGFVGVEVINDKYLSEKYNFIACRDPAELVELTKEYSCPKLLHLAGRFSGSHNDLWENNVDLTRKVIDGYLKGGGKTVVFLSTGAVYGNSNLNIKSKETDQTEPPNYYGFTKLICEMIIKEHVGRVGKYFILRLPNVYGPTQKKGVIYNFKQQIKDKRELCIEGDGEQVRDFLHVKDLLAAIDLILSYEGSSDIFNISSNLTITVNQLAKILIDDKAVKIKLVPDNNGLKKLTLDISKAQKTIKYLPKINHIELGV